MSLAAPMQGQPGRQVPPAPMKIALVTPWFLPHIGGVETVVTLLAADFSSASHEVTVLTTFPANGYPDAELPYRVLRQPGWRAELELMRGVDVVLAFTTSARLLWLPLLLRKPVLLNHAVCWRSRPFLAGYAQRWVCKRAHSSAPSRYVAERIPGGCSVLPNPYDSLAFCRPQVEERSIDVLFLGRLVPFKGADSVLPAVAHLARLAQSRGGAQCQVAFVGSGPMEGRLRQQAVELGVAAQTAFLGQRSGEALVQLLQRAKVLVAPSRGNEAFGMIVIEALACGCRVISSGRGGLQEAGGQSARVVDPDDVGAFAEQIAAALRDHAETGPLAVVDSLSKHERGSAAAAFLAALESVRRAGQQAGHHE